MSTVSQQSSTSNQSNTKYDFSKLFVRNNVYREITVAASGSDLTLTAGQLIGTIAATAKGAVMKSGSSDGSQFPSGIVANESITITDGTEAVISICNGGEVAEELLSFDGSDGLNTNVSDRIYRDRLKDLGIIARETDQLAAFDNE